ncbi:hypothetical protein HYT23_00905 [Candidatus Pacearchaeota archaeon]|nr:hypothetical protein [Candidatus Pacearchaeota archaeon]
MVGSPKESDNSQKELGEFMSMMDVVDIERRQDQAVQEQLTIDERKLAIKTQLRKTYEEMGVNATDSQLDSAIEDHYSKKWSFTSSAGGLGAKLVNMYINRGWIAKKIILPTLVAAGFIAGVYGGVKAIQHSAEVRREQAVEVRIEQAYNTSKELERKIAETSSSHFITQLPQNEKNTLEDKTLSARRKLDYTRPFFTEFSIDGQADKLVTLDNYAQADEKLKSTMPILEDAEVDVNSAKGIIQRQEQFVLTDNGLENLMAQVETCNSPKPLKEKATSAYEAGKSSIANRELDAARGAQTNLITILNDCNDFGNLKQEFSKLYNSAINAAVERLAIDETEDLNERAKSYVQVADVGSLRKAVSEIGEINTTLIQEYVIEVVNRSGIRSGLWRRSNDNPPRNSDDTDSQGKRFYLVCQAVEKDGDVVSLKLKNIEDQRVESVSMFGVGVPHEVYLRIKADKIDNWLVDNSSTKLENRHFSKKQKGYIHTEQIMTDNSGKPLGDMGFLTREENNWRKPR